MWMKDKLVSSTVKQGHHLGSNTQETKVNLGSNNTKY
jgi:hypothetical protein